MTVRVVTWETSRLHIRPWREADAAVLHPLFSDPDVMRHWNTPPLNSLEETQAMIAQSLAASPAFHAAWAVLDRAQGTMIGYVNYHHRDIRNRRLEVGFMIAQQFWRQGYGHEAMSPLLTHCFGELDAYRLEAMTSPENIASMRLLERLGFSFEGGPMRARAWTSDGRPLDANMFALLLPEWERAGGRGPDMTS